MRVGNFSVLVPEGRERESGYAILPHGAQYTLRLGNNDHTRRCDATVVIDGKDVGCFRVGTGQTVVLERPANDTGRFTFFKADTDEGAAAGVGGVSVQDRGLIQVTFWPEKAWRHRGPSARVMGSGVSGGGLLRSYGIGTIEPMGMSAGVTGLTGESDQQFTTVDGLDYDPANQTIISIRLVADQFVTTPAVRVLTPVAKGNRVPDPV